MALTTAMILNDPRWSDEGEPGKPAPAVALYDELVAKYGDELTAQVAAVTLRVYAHDFDARSRHERVRDSIDASYAGLL